MRMTLKEGTQKKNVGPPPKYSKLGQALKSCRHQGRDTEIAQNILRLSKPDMTIHWKALRKHFLMVPLVLYFPFKKNSP
jgi:hypothetical protein